MARFCGQCGRKLDEASGLCPKCNREEFKRYQATSVRRPRWVPIILIALAVLLGIVIILLSFDLLNPSHLFQPHQWQEAKCGMPEICTLCGDTRGDILEHQPGKTTTRDDIWSAAIITSVHCEICDAVISESSESMDTLMNGETFVFTSEQFFGRFYNSLKELSSDAAALSFSENSVSEDADSSGDQLIYFVSKNDRDIGILYTFDAEDNRIEANQKTNELVWSACFCVPCSQDEYETVSRNMLHAMMEACDPSVTQQEIDQYINRCERWFADCTEYNWPSSTFVKNGIIYTVDIITRDTGSALYVSAYATADISRIDRGDDAIVMDNKIVPLAIPNYTSEEAEQMLCGTWYGQIIAIDTMGETYALQIDDSSKNDIILSFRQDHSAEMTINAFALDKELGLSYTDFWHKREIQWDYLYDNGEGLFYLMDTPYMQQSIPLHYDPESSVCGLLRVWLSDSVSILFKK